MTERDDTDIHDRLDRLESLVERQAETIETLREDRAELSGEGDDGSGRDAPVSRRTALRAGGLLALLGIGAGTASADPQGQVGTATDPLTALYTEELNGGVTGDTELTDLVGSGLTINSGALEATGTSAWADGDGDDLLEPVSPFTGIDVSDVRASTLADASGNSHLTLNDGGPLDVNRLLDVDDNAIQSSSGNALTFHTDGGERTLELGVPYQSPQGGMLAGNVVAGHPNNAAIANARAVVIGGGGGDTGVPPGGGPNQVDGHLGTVSGGTGNAAGFVATVGGGVSNEASGIQSTVGGGDNNTASDFLATVGGGQANTASGFGATVGGGINNTASGSGSFAAGRLAKTETAGGTAHDGAFVWGDSSIDTVRSDADDQVVFQANGGMKVYTASDTSMDTGAELPAGSTSWAALSTRTAKSDIEAVQPAEVLERVESLEVATWRYDAEDEAVRHMGPIAEDFEDAFGLGHDADRISTVDADGVALAAIQGLSTELDDARSELDAKDECIDDLASDTDDLRAENDRLRERNAELEARLDRVEARLGLNADRQRGVADD